MSEEIRARARALGFDSVGVAAVESLDSTPQGAYFRAWCESGRAGQMHYLTRDPGRRLDPSRVLPGARSVVCVGLNYHQDQEGTRPEEAGRVAAYAWGRDYHKVFPRRLKTLEAAIQDLHPGCATRRYVDTGPVLEKHWAQRAGLGWQGKHTNLVSREFGSWLLLGVVLVDRDLETDAAHQDFCGTCVRCIEVCPTRAITAPHQLDPTLCISYLTIEHRGSIPIELRSSMGDHVFGCDDCLDVCPWNRFAQQAREADFRPRDHTLAPLLADLVTMDDHEFYRRFAGTPVTRAKREGLARNACVALGNVGGKDAVGVLEVARDGDASELVREHATWALTRLRDRGVIE